MVSKESAKFWLLFFVAIAAGSCKTSDLPPDKLCVAPTGIKTTGMANNVFRYLLSPETVADNVVSATYTVEASGKTVSIESSTAVASQAYATLPGPGNYTVIARYKTDCGDVSSLNANLSISQSACVPAEKIWVAPSISDPLQFQLSLVGGQGSSTNLQWKVKNGYDDYFTVSTTGASLYRVELPSADLYSVTLTYQTLCGETHTLNTLLVADLMNKISGGSFTRNFKNAENLLVNTAVVVSDFEIARTEMTTAQFKLFIEMTGYLTDAEKFGGGWTTALANNGFMSVFKSGFTWKHNGFDRLRNLSEYNHPVCFVSWNDADSCSKWLTKLTGQFFRLPTEAEWEFAAGNGSEQTAFSWGNYFPQTQEKVANIADESWRALFGNPIKFNYFYDDGFPITSPAISFSPNKLGLYNMIGNVGEWCYDWYGNYSEKNEVDPKGPPSGNNPLYPNFKVFRGSGWRDTYSSSTYVTAHVGGPINGVWGHIGFRVARKSK